MVRQFPAKVKLLTVTGIGSGEPSPLVHSRYISRHCCLAPVSVSAAESDHRRADGHNDASDDPLSESQTFLQQEEREDDRERNYHPLHRPYVCYERQLEGKSGQDRPDRQRSTDPRHTLQSTDHRDSAVFSADHREDEVAYRDDCVDEAEPETDISPACRQSVIVQTDGREGDSKECPSHSGTPAQCQERC